MTRQEVIDLMKSSKTEQDWDNNCDAVKKAFGGQYPQFWYQEIIMKGLGKSLSGGIQIVSIPRKGQGSN